MNIQLYNLINRIDGKWTWSVENKSRRLFEITQNSRTIWRSININLLPPTRRYQPIHDRPTETETDSWYIQLIKLGFRTGIFS